MKYIQKFISFIKESISFNQNFWKWFRNSKIKDAQGNPLVVYHGSINWDFEEFEKSWIGLTDEGYYGIGFYFTDEEEYAKEYGKNIYKCYLSCQNPFRIIYVNSTGDDRWFDLRDQLAGLKGVNLPHLKTIRTLPEGYYVKKAFDTWENNEYYSVYPVKEFYDTDKEIYGPDCHTELAAIVKFNDMLNEVDWSHFMTSYLINRIGKLNFTEILKRNGYDSVIPTTNNNQFEFSEICVFEPNQIKSIDNDGSWDLNDNNINS
jgi:hypothetical protein